MSVTRRNHALGPSKPTVWGSNPYWRTKKIEGLGRLT